MVDITQTLQEILGRITAWGIFGVINESFVNGLKQYIPKEYRNFAFVVSITTGIIICALIVKGFDVEANTAQITLVGIMLGLIASKFHDWKGSSEKEVEVIVAPENPVVKPTPEPLPTPPQTISMYEKYKEKYLGGRIDFDGAYQYQCVDLSRHFAHEMDYESGWGAYGGSAITGRENKNNTFGSDWIRVQNKFGDVNNYPSQGDIIFFGKEFGTMYGHVAIVDNTDGVMVTVLEQNGKYGQGTGLGGDSIRLSTYRFKHVLGRYTRKGNI